MHFKYRIVLLHAGGEGPPWLALTLAANNLNCIHRG